MCVAADGQRIAPSFRMPLDQGAQGRAFLIETVPHIFAFLVLLGEPGLQLAEINE